MAALAPPLSSSHAVYVSLPLRLYIFWVFSFSQIVGVRIVGRELIGVLGYPSL
jgi:hypothetical protein